MIRILHFSDLHLDHSFATCGLSPAAGNSLRADLRAVLGRILTVAREQQIHAVTIGGDLYEQDFALPATAEFLRAQFERLKPIRVFISPGASDPYVNDSLYSLTRWPENVTVFSNSRLEAVELTPGVNLWGAACPPQRGANILDGWHTDRAGTNLLLLYAPPADAGQPAGYHIAELSLSSTGISCALLGGAHTTLFSLRSAPHLVYPGSPEPLCFESSAAQHHLALVTVQSQECNVELLPASRWRFCTLTVNVSSLDARRAGDDLHQQLTRHLGSFNERTICRVILTGVPTFDFDLATLQEDIDPERRIKLECAPMEPEGVEDLLREQTVRGLLVRRFQEKISQATTAEDRQKLAAARQIALHALSAKRVSLHEIS